MPREKLLVELSTEECSFNYTNEDGSFLKITPGDDGSLDVSTFSANVGEGSGITIPADIAKLLTNALHYMTTLERRKNQCYTEQDENAKKKR